MFISRLWLLIRTIVLDAKRHPVHQMAGALAFFALFSLPPLVAVLLIAGGAVYGDEAARKGLVGQVEEHLGPESRATLESVIEHLPELGVGDLGTQILAVGALVFGAMIGFNQLQRMLNTIWDAPRRRSWLHGLARLLKRGVSFGLLVTTGFLLLAFLGMSALMDVFPKEITAVLPPSAAESVQGVLELFIAFVLLTLHFLVIFKVLPDTYTPWQGVLLASLLTSVLFILGRWALELVLQYRDFASPFGAAGSLVVTVIWLYGAALVILFGALFSHAWSRWRDLSAAATTSCGGDDAVP
jgi:membrane protein